MFIIDRLYRLKKKMLKTIRKIVFCSVTKQKCVGLNIKGHIDIFNTNIVVGKNVTLYPGVSFQGEGDIVIGDNTFIGNGTIIYSEKGYKVYIGKNCMIAGLCYIINTNHKTDIGMDMNKQGTDSSDIFIEDDVWVSGNVQILKGCTIKKGSVIGAKALVTKDTEAYGIYVGCPAKILKKR